MKKKKRIHSITLSKEAEFIYKEIRKTKTALGIREWFSELVSDLITARFKHQFEIKYLKYMIEKNTKERNRILEESKEFARKINKKNDIKKI